MRSPLEQKIEQRIATATDPGLRAFYFAQLACYLARIGDFARAESMRLELRRSFGDGNFPRVSVLIMLLEGLLQFFKNLDLGGRDRIVRAKAISEFIQQEDLVSLTSAWLAHICFNQAKFLEMKEQINYVLSHLKSDDGSALCRVALVLGDAFLYTNQFSKSMPWYTIARTNATALGDRAAIGAITYNSAALDLQNYRLLDTSKIGVPKGLSVLKTKVETAANYENLVQLKSLNDLVVIMRCEVSVLQRDFNKAADDIRRFFSASEFNSKDAQHIRLAADLSWCSAMCGDVKSSDKWQRIAIEGSNSLVDLDDQAIAYCSLARASDACGSVDISSDQWKFAKTKIRAHKREIAKITKIIDEFSDAEIFLGDRLN